MIHAGLGGKGDGALAVFRCGANPSRTSNCARSYSSISRNRGSRVTGLGLPGSFAVRRAGQAQYARRVGRALVARLKPVLDEQAAFSPSEYRFHSLALDGVFQRPKDMQPAAAQVDHRLRQADCLAEALERRQGLVPGRVDVLAVVAFSAVVDLEPECAQCAYVLGFSAVGVRREAGDSEIGVASVAVGFEQVRAQVLDCRVMGVASTCRASS